MNARSNKQSSSATFWLVIIAFVLAIAAITFSLVGSGNQWNAPAEVKIQKNPFPATVANLTAAKAIYGDRCANCHGLNGDGRGPEAQKLSVAPQDFTDGRVMSGLTDGELYWKIGVGRRPMPSFKNRLSGEQRWLLVDYVRTFAAVNKVARH